MDDLFHAVFYTKGKALLANRSYFVYFCLVSKLKQGFMKKNKPGKLRTRIFTSYLTSTVSITLVLFLLGVLFFIVLNAGRLTEYVREKIGFTVVLQDDLPDAEIARLEKELQLKPWIKSYRYVDKEMAAKELTRDLGVDFNGFLGSNPLSSAFEIKLHAPYTQKDSLAVLELRFQAIPGVKEVFYQQNLVSVINENVSRIMVLLLLFSGLLFFVFSVLINNTIRISVYAQRFIINNMLLVGATRGFVRRPFVRKGIMLGAWGAALSCLLLTGLIITIKKEFNGVITVNDFRTLGLVFLMVTLAGIVLSWLSTFFSVNRFLKMKFDELFY
jgi:cell division transport system permease protein